jgi:hypothetical protein
MPTFKFDATPLNEILIDYAKAREIDIPQAVLANARLLCVELARRTQPFGNSPAGGEGKVRSDINLVISPESKLLESLNKITNEKIRRQLVEAYYGKDYTTMNLIFARIGWKRVEKLRGESALTSTHNANRFGRKRHTKRPGTPYYADDQALKGYIAKVQQRVGLSKAGWLEAAESIPSTISQSTESQFPPFVRRNANQGNGNSRNKTGNLKEPTVVVTNTTPWVSGICNSSDQTQAGQVVVAKMKKQMEKILKYRNKD